MIYNVRCIVLATKTFISILTLVWISKTDTYQV